MLHDDNKS